MKDWELYEDQVFDRFRSDFPDCLVEKDQRIPGRFSRTHRQVDISIKREVAGCPLVGVVDCKHFSRKVDVKIVDSFVGFLEDVGADFGVIITTEGFTDAAQNRAKASGIRLKVVKLDNVEYYYVWWHECQICDPGPDRPPSFLEFGSAHGVFYDDDTVGIIRVGHCNWCNSTHVECQVCGTITPIWECDYDEPLECEGGCGLRFRVTRSWRDDFEERFEILPSSSQLLADGTR